VSQRNGTIRFQAMLNSPSVKGPLHGTQPNELRRKERVPHAKQPTTIAVGYPDASDGPSMPSSTEAVALYEIARPVLSLATNLFNRDNEYRLTPIETDLGALAVIAALSDSQASVKNGMSSRNPSVTLSRKQSVTVTRNSSMTAFELPGGSVLALITPEQSAWQRSIYLPGKICLGTNTHISPGSNLTPLDLLQESVEHVFRNHEQSENALADEIAAFFESFGSGYEPQSLNTDKFWLNFPVVQPQTGSVETDWHLPPFSTPEVGQRTPSWYHDLPGDFFPSTKRPFAYTSRASSEWEKRTSAASSSQKSQSSTIFPSPPSLLGLPSPSRPPQFNNQRTSKPSKRTTAVSSPPRMSLRRLFHSASGIV